MTSPTPINSNQLSRTPLTDPAGTFCDAVNSNITPNSGATVFRIVNTDTTAHTVTFDSIPTEDGLALADLVVTIPSSTTQWAAGFDEETFGAQLTYLASSALTVAASMATSHPRTGAVTLSRSVASLPSARRNARSAAASASAAATARLLPLRASESSCSARAARA